MKKPEWKGGLGEGPERQVTNTMAVTQSGAFPSVFRKFQISVSSMLRKLEKVIELLNVVFKMVGNFRFAFFVVNCFPGVHYHAETILSFTSE